MATITKEFLSASTNGRGIKIAATATPGTQIHAAHATAKDEVYLWVTNTDTVERKVTFELGGVTAPDDNLTMNIPAGETILVVPGLVLSGSVNVKAFGAAANVLAAFGFVNRIS
ncbi:hypothetical protein [Hyphomicrobium sp.]|uniref:hypothetical protein n=1 Tax=Hyphomicrobium sp. TaxID=82 RepID=UPI001328F28C|nr:hypothetical protein [Hyphomicrobium sp.]KAB2937403.1 MAG: hypothetical protein F9K20_20135 [Hyphomicrobium sp.]